MLTKPVTGARMDNNCIEYCTFTWDYHSMLLLRLVIRWDSKINVGSLLD